MKKIYSLILACFVFATIAAAQENTNTGTTGKTIPEDQIELTWNKYVTDLVIDNDAIDAKQQSITLPAGYHTFSFTVKKNESIFEYGGKKEGNVLSCQFKGGLSYMLDVTFEGRKYWASIKIDAPYIVEASKYTMKTLKMPPLEKEIEIIEGFNVSRPYEIVGNVKSILSTGTAHYKKVLPEEHIYRLKEVCQEYDIDAFMFVHTIMKMGMTYNFTTEAVAIKYTD